MKIFVDDMRVPIDKEWILASSVEEAKDLIIKSNGHFALSLDHDLGEREGQESTTRPLIGWMIRNGYKPYGAVVHSSNPVGAQWLETALERDFDTPIPKIETPQWGL